MTIKNILCDVCLAGTVALAVLSSCAGDDAMGEGYSSNRDMLSNPTALEIAGNATETEFELKALGKWEVEKNLPEWLTLAPSSGVGSATVRVTTTGENPSSVDIREATITIKSDNKTNTIKFTQKVAPFAMEVDTGGDESISFTKDDKDQKRDFRVTSNCAWWLGNDAATYSKWFDITPTSGERGNTTVTVTCKMNNVEEIPYYVDLIINPDANVPNSKAQTVHVEQKGIETSFALNTDKMTVKPAGATFVFKVEDKDNNSTWEAHIYTDIAGWISMKKDGVTADVIEGKGQAQIEVTCAPTNQQGVRNARIVVTKKYDSSFSKTLTVDQTGTTAPSIPADNITVTPHKHGATVSFTPVSDLPVSDCVIKYYKKSDGTSTAKTLPTTADNEGNYTAEITDLISMTDYMVCVSAKNNVGTTTTDYRQFTTTGGIPGENDTPIPGLSNKRK